MTYLPNDETTAPGRYQVLLYDNNFGAAESYPKFDWGQLGAAVVTDYSKGTHSFGRIFTVDEATSVSYTHLCSASGSGPPPAGTSPLRSASPRTSSSSRRTPCA